MEKRFYISKENIVDDSLTGGSSQLNTTIELTGVEHNHFSKVLRGKVGERIECFYDSSDIFVCEVDEISKNRTICHIVDIIPCLANPKINVTLFQGLPKLDKLELITQKLCEIGASRIIPFTSNFTIAKDNPAKIDRLDKIVVSSCKQCQRTSLLKVEKTIKFDEMVKMLKTFDLVIFANEQEDGNNLIDILLSSKTCKNIAYIVGSEGGFSNKEIELLKPLCKSVSLGRRILRTETAAIAICADIFCTIEN